MGLSRVSGICDKKRVPGINTLCTGAAAAFGSARREQRRAGMAPEECSP
eukprot:COSAG02_NODE_67577_length_252_cov_1.339869_1_plen_48_part_10